MYQSRLLLDAFAPPALHYAYDGNVDAVRALAEHGKADLSRLDTKGRTILHAIAMGAATFTGYIEKRDIMLGDHNWVRSVEEAHAWSNNLQRWVDVWRFVMDTRVFPTDDVLDCEGRTVDDEFFAILCFEFGDTDARVMFQAHLPPVATPLPPF